MVGFLGHAEYSIDDKGRVALPARMRRELTPAAKETFVATRGYEQCITLIPLNVWEEKAERISKLSPFSKEARIVKRMESRWSEVVTLDGQGRISLPRTLIEYAGLSAGNGGKVIILGTTDNIEVWDPAILQAEDDAIGDSYASLVERVMNQLEEE